MFIGGTATTVTVSGQGQKTTEPEKVFFLIYNQQFADAAKALNLFSSGVDPMYIEILQTELFWWKTLNINSKTEFEHFESYLMNKY